MNQQLPLLFIWVCILDWNSVNFRSNRNCLKSLGWTLISLSKCRDVDAVSQKLDDVQQSLRLAAWRSWGFYFFTSLSMALLLVLLYSGRRRAWAGQENGRQLQILAGLCQILFGEVAYLAIRLQYLYLYWIPAPGLWSQYSWLVANDCGHVVSSKAP